MKQKINGLSAETEVGEHPDHLHWGPSIPKEIRQTDSFSPLYDMSGNLNVPIMFIRGVRQQCRESSKPSHFSFVYFPLHSCSKQIENKLMIPTFNKEFSFFLIAWVLNSDNNFTKSVVIQKWYKQL